MFFECKQVGKNFGALAAVRGVSFAVSEGEALGIMGPNGAGKSTLLNLIMGVYPLTGGEIYFDGQKISGQKNSVISGLGIGRTYQIPRPFHTMTVLENLQVGDLYGGDHRSMRDGRDRAMALLDRVGLSKRAETVSGTLGLLDLKRLELAKALSLEPRLLLLDEIAGGLIDREVEQLQALLADLKSSGMTMIIIEHVLNVMFEHSDRIVVLDFGEILAEGTPDEIVENEKVIEVYLGEDRAGRVDDPEEVTAAFVNEIDSERLPILEVSNLQAGYGKFQALFGVSMEILEGEIVALIGLNGAGKTTLIRAITRQLPWLDGDVLFSGESLRDSKMQDVAELGIAQCIEGRKIFPRMTIEENLELGAYPAHARAQRHETIKRVYDLFPRLDERKNQLGGLLSGGEQQMLAIGRALMARPKFIIFDEISLGLAPIIINEMYRAILEINAQGTSVLLVEQNVHRSLEIAQRAYIIERGRIVLSGTTDELSQDDEIHERYFGFEGE